MTAILMIVATLAVYRLAKWTYRRYPYMLLSPVLVCPLILIGLLAAAQIPYAAYNEGGQLLTYMLQPATVALAVPMYKHRRMIVEYLPEIAICVSGGAVMGIVTSMGFAELAGLPGPVVDSLALRAITTPLAISVAQILGGNATMTAVFVVITGLVGTVLTSVVVKYTKLKNSVAAGMMFGISAHGIGTAKAHEFGYLEGAISSLAMIFMGIITAFIAPSVIPLCHSLLQALL